MKTVDTFGDFRQPWESGDSADELTTGMMSSAISRNYVLRRSLLKCVRIATQPNDARGNSSNADASTRDRVHISEVKAFIERCMLSAGAKMSHGCQLAEVLVAADYRGHFSHGLNRLG